MDASVAPARSRRVDATVNSNRSFSFTSSSRPKRRDAAEKSPEEARRTARLHLGHVSQAMEAFVISAASPGSTRSTSDVRFGWRQLNKHRAVSLAAILSLGLAIGATTAAFRLVDAVLLRPLPVADSGRLFVVSFTEHDPQNRPDTRDDFDYPTYRRYANVIGERADLMVVGMTARQDIIVATSEPEKAFRAVPFRQRLPHLRTSAGSRASSGAGR